MFRKVTIFVAILFFLPILAEAQFGKNKVLWEKVDENYYRSAHFEFYHSLDLNDKWQYEHFNRTVNQLEKTFEYLSKKLDHSLMEGKGRVPVIQYRTHSTFEATHIIGGFLPEGVGAFAESYRNRLVIKMDFLPPLNDTIAAHELSHIFQFDMMKLNLVRVASGQVARQLWFLEGGAEFLANSYRPYTRDDIRRMQQRGVAANPEKDLPSIYQLNQGRANPYTIGAMVFEFIEGKYGSDVALEFLISGLKERGRTLFEILYELTEGDISIEDDFDQAHRNYWSKLFAHEMLSRPMPYQETENFKGRTLTPRGFPYPLTSSVLSPNGEYFVSFSIQKNGISLVKFPARQERPKPKKRRQRGPGIISVQDDDEEDDDDKKEKKETEKERKKRMKKESRPKNLTPKMPPYPIEYLISQKLNTWPFDGFDANWSRDGERIALFAKKRRDHALYIIEPEKGDILQAIEVPLDQSFSPIFDPTGKKVYFSAAKNVTRNIYVVDLETEEVTNLTNDLAFNVAPTVSPDGKTLAYVSFVGDFQKLFLLNLETGEKTQLTFNRFNDSTPSFSEDGEHLIYTSDEDSRIWNIYTIDLTTKTVKQWTNLYGGAFTPRYINQAENRIYYTAYWQYDQFRSFIYPNFELYEATLKKPIREYVMVDKKEPMEWVFRSEDSFWDVLDENQILNPEKAPRNWLLSGRGVAGGYSTYWGMFGYSSISLSDIKSQHHHFFRFALYGNYFRVIDYTYLDQSNRTNWGIGVFSRKIPLQYILYNVTEGSPKQPILNQTIGQEHGASLFAFYPMDKFNRFEFTVEGRRRDYTVFNTSPEWAAHPDTDPESVQLYNFMQNSSHSNVSFAAAYVRDTVLYSNATQGPLHGNAVRLEAEVSPLSTWSFKRYFKASFDVRKYMRLSAGSLFAVRAEGFWDSSETGDFLLMGGPDKLRGYPYGSIVGNQAAYGSAELRFPIIDAIVFPKGMGIGPFRGFIFADFGIAKFNSNERPSQRGISTGIGIQWLPFNYVWTRREMDGFKFWSNDFFISMNF